MIYGFIAGEGGGGANFAKIKAITYFAKFLNAFIKPQNLNFSRNKLYIWNLQITRFKMIYMFVF